MEVDSSNDSQSVGNQIENPRKRVLQLLSMIKYYEAQLSKIIDNESVFYVTPNVSLKALEEAITEAQETLIEARQYFQSQEQVMQTLQEKYALSQTFGWNQSTKTSTSTSRKQKNLGLLEGIQSDAMKCIELDAEIEVMLKDTQAKKEERLALTQEMRQKKKRLFDVIDRRRQQRNQLDDKTLSQIKKLERRIEIGQSRIKLCKLILNEFIIAAEVDWQADDQLKKLMEEVGKI